MNKHAGPLVLSAALLGVIAGGVYAGAHAFAPVTHEPAKVVNVQNAGQAVTPTPTTTTAVVKPAPKPVAKPAPVKSARKAPAKKVAPQTVQRQAVVSETPAEPQPSKPAPFGTNPVNGAPNPPPVDWGTNDKPAPPPPSN